MRPRAASSPTRGRAHKLSAGKARAPPPFTSTRAGAVKRPQQEQQLQRRQRQQRERERDRQRVPRAANGDALLSVQDLAEWVGRDCVLELCRRARYKTGQWPACLVANANATQGGADGYSATNGTDAGWNDESGG